jgi:hypothetical protein
LREREFSDAAAIFSLHDTRARWIAFKDSYIQGQRSSGRTPHFFSLYCLLVGRKKKKKRTWCVLCMPQNPAGTYLELCYHLFWLDSLFLSLMYILPSYIEISPRYIIARLYLRWIIDRPLFPFSVSLRLYVQRDVCVGLLLLSLLAVFI